MKRLRCPNLQCPRKQSKAKIIIRYGFYRTRWGRRRRFRCTGCGKTFCRNRGTVYHRLQHRRATFDEVAALSVEGLNKSTIARVKRLAWNTVDRWLEKAARECHRFNDRRIIGLKVTELQADAIRTMVGGKKQPTWIFVSIDVWSHLWPSTIVGRRSYRNTLSLFRDLSFRMVHKGFPVIATDGFKFYQQVVWRIFGVGCLYGQVVKKRRKDRIVKVEHKTRLGPAWRWEQAWKNSEDSRKLNTSYIERLNLTIRQGSAFLCRRTLSHARRVQRLRDHLELLRCHYNFLRPHRALKFGHEFRTPAMQAGLTSRRLTFREIFTSIDNFFCLIRIVWEFILESNSTGQEDSAVSEAA